MEDLTFAATYSEEIYSIRSPLTVVIDCSWKDLDERHRELLGKILKAVGQSMESVRIIHQPAFDLSKWVDKPSHLLAFIKPPSGVALYEAIPTGQSVIVFSEPLTVLMASDASKRKLWDSLKNLFGA